MRGSRVIGGGAASSKEERRVDGVSRLYGSEDIEGREKVESSSRSSHGMVQGMVRSSEKGTAFISGAGA